MSLALSVVRHVGEQFITVATKPLVAARCCIGRGRECDIVLEDPSRRVSRIHATISHKDDSYVLTVDSRVNPVIVNHGAITVGQSVILSVGDKIAIGDYVLSVVSGDGESKAAPNSEANLFDGPSIGRGGARSDLDALFNVPATPRASVQPKSGMIDELIGGHRQHSDDPLLGILGGQPAAMPSKGNAHTGEEHNDPLMRLLGETQPFSAVSSGGTAGGIASIDSLLGLGAPAGVDPLGLGVSDNFSASSGFGGGRGGSLELDHVHDIHLPFVPPEAHHLPDRIPTPAAKVVPEREDDPLAAILGNAKDSRRLPGKAQDPLGFLNDLSDGRTDVSHSVDDVNLLAMSTAIVPPKAAVQQKDPYSAAAGSSMAQAVDAFLKGAALGGVKVSDEEAEAFMRECGAVCRASIEGIMGLLLARATVKDQLGASDRTMVSASENNPLKLIEGVDEAVRFVFDRKSRSEAFLPPDKAVADACTDLQLHEIALVAGMRSALMGAIKRFNPAVIEKKFDKGGGSSLLANKKAKLWDTFVAFYQETNRDAEDNFDGIFGVDFLRAYHEQLKRLKSK